jgi:hypothetical protein
MAKEAFGGSGRGPAVLWIPGIVEINQKREVAMYNMDYVNKPG